MAELSLPWPEVAGRAAAAAAVAHAAPQAVRAPGVATFDLAACVALMRGGSKTFHAASRLLPKQYRDAATALYSFCRVADDAVDLCGPGFEQKSQAVALLNQRLDDIAAGRPGPELADQAMAYVMRVHGIPKALPAALIEGFAWDAKARQYDRLEDLLDYAARVAASVGAMMALVMGVRSEAALARACELGLAMQLTNIARDVGEDAREGRLFLPLDWLREEGIEPTVWLAAPTQSPALARVVQRLLAEADVLYARAQQGVAALPYACRPAIEAASRVYAEIGREVERRGCDSMNTRAVVPVSRKLVLLAQAVAVGYLGSAAVTPDGQPLSEEPTAGAGVLASIRFLVSEAIKAAPINVIRERPDPDANFYQRTVWLLEMSERVRLERFEARRVVFH